MTGFVRTLLRDNSSILIGGTFTLVGGQARTMLAEVDDAIGTLSPWDPAPNGTVLSLIMHGGTVYCGGSFTSIGGIPRTSLAAIDRATGIPTSWAPSVNGAVNQLCIWNDNLIIGGFMSQVQGLANQHLASYSIATGVLNTPPPAPSSTVYAMVVHGDELYTGGVFTLINPNIPRLRFAAWSLCQPTTWYADGDGDGLGDPSVQEVACTAPTGFVGNNDDCNDSDPELLGPTLWFADSDNDGAGDANMTTLACVAPPGYVHNSDDCDDGDPELISLTIWYLDGDGDGYGNIFAPTQLACGAPAGYVDNPDDCNDSNPNIHTIRNWFADTDEDGFGDPLVPLSACNQPPGFVADSTDCDDDDQLWFIGAACDDGDPATEGDVVEADCVCRGSGVQVEVRVWLEGAYTPGSLMSASLFQNGLIPLTEPYTALGYTHIGGGGETTTMQMLDPFPGTDEHTAVDWVVLELRDQNQPSLIVATQSCILRRNGLITRTDGLDLPVFMVAADGYFVAVRHRNHLGFHSLFPVNLGVPIPPVVDFASGQTATAGTNALKPMGQRMVMWSGDAQFDRNLKYTGSANDRDLILQRIGGIVPTNTVSGYYPEDLNLDGQVRYTGTNNDRDLILQNIGGVVPTTIRYDQLPN